MMSVAGSFRSSTRSERCPPLAQVAKFYNTGYKLQLDHGSKPCRASRVMPWLCRLQSSLHQQESSTLGSPKAGPTCIALARLVIGGPAWSQLVACEGILDPL